MARRSEDHCRPKLGALVFKRVRLIMNKKKRPAFKGRALKAYVALLPALGS